MSKNFIGLLPSGNAPSVLKAEILEMVKTEAPAPDLTGYTTKGELDEALAQFTPAEELANRVATLESGSTNGVQVVDNGNGTVTLTL